MKNKILFLLTIFSVIPLAYLFNSGSLGYYILFAIQCASLIVCVVLSKNLKII